MKKVLMKIIFLLISFSVILTGCTDLFGEYDNINDPESPNYLGSPKHPSPQDGGAVHTLTPLLIWEKIDNAEKYHVQVSTTKDFTATSIFMDDQSNDPEFNISADLQNGSTYYWRVRSINKRNQHGEWSGVWSFYVEYSDAVIQFDDDSYSCYEDSENITLIVTRSGTGIGTVSIDYTTQDGSAMGGMDYTYTHGTLTWDEGDISEKSITIPIFITSFPEFLRTFNVVLNGPTGGATLGELTTVTVTIKDGSSKLAPNEVQFGSATYTINEGAGTVTLILKRTGGVIGYIDVSYSTSDGTAIAAADYTAKNGDIGWSGDDATDKTISISITDDSVIEGNETFYVTLSSLTNTSIGAIGQATVTIVDDDENGAVPLPAITPNPSNEASNISTNIDLSWSNGGGATSYDVYFGTDGTPDSGEYQGNQTGTSFDPGSLSYNTTYYWRIDAQNLSGTTEGTVWSFTTEEKPPNPATNPTPSNSTSNVSITTNLSWSNGGGATSYDVYFGTDSSPDYGEFQGNQTGNSFDPGELSYNTTYYWRIGAKNSSYTVLSSVWSFTTEQSPLISCISGATVTAISEGTYLGITQYAYNTIDGDENTGWSSSRDMPAWFRLKFNQIYRIEQIVVWWGTHRHDFVIEISQNSIDWTIVKTGTSNNMEGDSPKKQIFDITPQDARYLKINIISTSAPEAHIFQASINEIEVYGRSL